MAMAAEESSKPQQSKWEGKLCAELKGVTAEQVWPLLEDFFNLHKWFPAIDTCKPLEGVSVQPGCVRYCAITKSPPAPSSESSAEEKEIAATTTWANERLVAIDPVERSLTYEVTENSMGIKSYLATMKVFQLSKAAAAEAAAANSEGCKIEWSLEADPIEGLTSEAFLSYCESSLKGMAQRMEDALCRTPTTL
ncbi:lachrymatory-factor synthase-like [Macadamia integrifolia]|uniref:lachrymatory-factor synthase-like n=1 Tax=Macadamia integrifolia TaxID=60698 RepID=UPI001C4FF50F|nr:lachrymatory-factor synthase-like [Macadamia integrifolia]